MNMERGSSAIFALPCPPWPCWMSWLLVFLLEASWECRRSKVLLVWKVLVGVIIRDLVLWIGFRTYFAQIGAGAGCKSHQIRRESTSDEAVTRGPPVIEGDPFSQSRQKFSIFRKMLVWESGPKFGKMTDALSRHFFSNLVSFMHNPDKVSRGVVGLGTNK